MVGEALEAGVLHARLPGLADGMAPSLVLVVGADISNAGVEPHPDGIGSTALLN
jgi:hypothetical protein